MADLLTLAAGDIALALAPAAGGSIARFDWRGSPVMRPAPAAFDDALQGACFPLVPFCNRIRGGRFGFEGREIVLAPNLPGDPSPLHGQGWRSAWDVVEAHDARATLQFRHAAGEWPWAYEAIQTFALDSHGLTVTVACRNTDQRAMPCGLGLHPYFPCSPDARVRTQVAGAYTIDALVLPVDRVPATGRYDLSDRLACGQDLDHGFDGWSGHARMEWPSRGIALELRSDDARFFQLYSPPTGELFVAEPVGHANAALNEDPARWPELGIRVLAPDEEMALSARFEPHSL